MSSALHYILQKLPSDVDAETKAALREHVKQTLIEVLKHIEIEGDETIEIVSTTHTCDVCLKKFLYFICHNSYFVLFFSSAKMNFKSDLPAKSNANELTINFQLINKNNVLN